MIMFIVHVAVQLDGIYGLSKKLILLSGSQWELIVEAVKKYVLADLSNNLAAYTSIILKFW